MHDGIDYSEIGRKERIGDVVSDAMPLRDRKPAVDMHMQVGHIRAAISADANLVHFHDAGDIAGKRLDRGGLAADFSVNELLKRRIGDLPRDMEDEQRDKNRTNRVNPCKRRPDMRDDYRDGDRNRADGVRPMVTFRATRRVQRNSHSFEATETSATKSAGSPGTDDSPETSERTACAPSS